MSRSIAWWVLKAQSIQPRACPHCHDGRTAGRYVITPSGKERVVEEYCRTCGWNEAVFSQDTGFVVRDHRAVNH